jgi:isopentenyl phosphate kinase
MDVLIVKFGGSVITKKSKDEKSVNFKKLDMLSGELNSYLRKKGAKAVVVHGAGAYGHVPAKKYRLKNGLKAVRQIRGVSETRMGMEELNQEVVGSLCRNGINAMAYQPSAAGIMKNGRIIEFNLKPLKGMLNAGLTPVLYGDVLFDSSLGVSILSGDQLVPYLAKSLSAKKVVIITSHNGVFDKNPTALGAKKIDRISPKSINALDNRKPKGTDVTGGINGKLSELITLANEGIPSEIVGAERGMLKNALKGEMIVGTIIER